jgi:hypothetical protein
VGVNPNFSGGTGPVNTTLVAPAPNGIASGNVTGGFNSSGSAQVWADIGLIKVSGDSVGSLNSLARGIFRDQLMIDVPGLASGSQVQITFDINVSGTLSVNQSNIASAGWTLRADVGGGAYDLGSSATLYNNSPVLAVHGYVGDLMGVQHSGPTTVQTGFWLPVNVQFEAVAQTSYDGWGGALATASFDFSHTIRWGGMTVWVNGVPQASAVVSSQSGMDFLHATPVPEPESWLMLALGLGALGAITGRRLAGAQDLA